VTLKTVGRDERIWSFVALSQVRVVGIYLSPLFN
jgi:hypothetical protein